jgi:hypothetical protein
MTLINGETARLIRQREWDTSNHIYCREILLFKI